jgi:hypothetical protein
MEYLALALVIVAAMAYTLVDKWLDQKQSLNTAASEDALTAAVDELSKKLDSRINKCFENHQFIKTELDSMKLQFGLKVRN